MNLRSKKFWFSITSFLLLVGGLFAALILVQRKQLIEKKAAESTATLRFGVESFVDLNPADLVDTNIILNPSGQEVVAVDAVINFTKEVLELVSIDPSGAQTNTNFKTFLPIVSETDCSFSPNINGANQTGRLFFSAVTFDCNAAGGEGALTDPVSTVVADPPLAWLHFKVRDGVTPGATGTISFYYTGEGETTDSNVVLNPMGDTVDDILLEPTSTVSVSVAAGASPSPSPSPSPEVSPSPNPSPDVSPGPSPSPGGKKGDISGEGGVPDGVVDEIDYSALIIHFGETGTPGEVMGDISGEGGVPDGVVDEIDYSALIMNFGQ